jgi:hypothetical protein
MKKTILAVTIAVAGMVASAASAAVIGYTEGTRPLVAGTTAIPSTDTSPNPSGAFNLGAVGPNTFEVYGRIVDSRDNFRFGFNSATGFALSWIFGGYDLAAGGFVSDSGFVSEAPAAEKTATFKLLDADNGFAVLRSATFTTDVTSGTELIFSAGAGNYVIQIDGQTPPNNAGSGVGLYDIAISAVPLPASALLLIAGVAGLGVAARRKKAA